MRTSKFVWSEVISEIGWLCAKSVIFAFVWVWPTDDFESSEVWSEVISEIGWLWAKSVISFFKWVCAKSVIFAFVWVWPTLLLLSRDN